MRNILLFIFSLLLLPATAVFSKADVVLLDKVVAVVDDNIITQLELEDRIKLIQQQLKQQGNRVPPTDIFRKQVLERLIIEKLQLEMAEKTGVRVNDETVNNVVANIARENKLSMEQFRQVLQKEGYQFSDFRENIRKEIIISRLRKVRVANKVNVSEQEIENHIARYKTSTSANTKYLLKHILIATPEAASSKQIEAAKNKAQKIVDDLKKGDDFSEKAITHSDDELALKGGTLGWRTLAQLPNLFSSTVDSMALKSVQGPLRSASGFHIIKLEDKRSGNNKNIVKQTLARHILIRPTQVLSREEARSRLQGILQRIKSGEDFAALAQASSDDKASAAEGGSLGWVNPGTMVPAFEEEMNKLQPGEISEPFLTQFGWHFVQVLSRRNHDNTDEFQRSQAIQFIRKNKTEEATQDWLRRLRAEAYVDYRTNK